MKKIFLALSILCNIGLATYVFYAYRNTAGQATKTSKEKHASTQCKIAILTPVSHPSLEQIQQGFIDTMNKKSELACDFTVYNANGNRTLMRSQAEEIVQSGYDLIFTIGAQASQVAKEVTTKKQKLTPIVFGAVSRPVDINLVQSEQSSGNHLTGVTELVDYELQLSLLQTLKPNVKNILLVYNPAQGAGLEKDQQAIQAIMQQKNITLKTIEIYNTNEIYSKVAPSLDQIDVVMVLKDNMVVSGIDGLVKLCNQHNIALYATDLDSVDKGAALGFGVHEYDFGVNAANKAKLILEQKIAPTKIPVTPVPEQKIKVNRKAMGAQGLAINPMMLFLMQSSEVVQ